MKIAVYGGSFDPPHLGHVMVPTHLLLNDPSIDTVWVIPCFQQTGKQLADFQHRYQMCLQAFGWLPRVAVLDVEARLGGESVTLRTFQHLKAQCPDEEFRFVMGSDLTEAAQSWEGWDELVKIAPPLIVGRAGITSPDGPTPISPAVSSTIVRRALRTGGYHEAGRYLPREVLEYIQKHRLYLESPMGEVVRVEESLGVVVTRAGS